MIYFFDISSGYAKILGETKFQLREFPLKSVKSNERRRERERVKKSESR